MTPLSPVLLLSPSRNAIPDSKTLRDRERVETGLEAEALGKIATENTTQAKHKTFYETLFKTRC